ncbi:uncharacterized protein C8R40DRAFT_1165504 [Lentinula edodes]|uniref:uncharacterized protein n=1 Tax=Lentinula edodes TaxID=5353 RepID=UPI001E8E0029|nr:uncharacterized protein C8R40DRAFT_1165504 [Lentinula edodes]KAH7880544.1 hypothetical protein C8R40DRAFT_1165504 [Lentinula edodes]
MASPLNSQPYALKLDNSSFVPRKEFQIAPRRNPSSFSLLCFAGSNMLRLYAFPSSVVSAFRRFFDKRIHAEKTDHHNNFTQFELEGKLWTTKSLATERLLVEMLNIVYQSRFTYLSTIDYGRESDDRLAIAFSRPSPPSEYPASSSSSSPKVPSLAPIPDQPRPRVPFALSFPSATVLRVICPPLHSTPAILQAVRGAWPRGVQSEKKVGENSFEFKLKGYRWFQEDTFATDSLQYILTLLSSLDAHSFTLQASISLTNRSRNKDFWIFTGPPPPDELNSQAPSIHDTFHTDFHGQQQHASGLHTRTATEPILSSSPLPPSYHARIATDNVGRNSPSGSSGSLPSPGLRKAAPRAQVPVSVHDTDIDIPETLGYRVDLPSVVPDGVVNMTGVGAASHTPDVFYSTSPFGDLSVAPIPLSSSPHAGVAASPPASPRKTQPLQHSHTSSESTPIDPSIKSLEMEGDLLSPGVFKNSGIYRDSAFSSNSDVSAEIPIKWTGAHRESQQIREEKRISEGPKFPGGWEASPIEEKEEIDATGRVSLNFDLDQNKHPEMPVYDVRVASPEITMAVSGTRKSEAGLIELNNATFSPPPPLPTQSSSDDAPSSPKGKPREVGSGAGWVLVNIEGKNDNGTVAPPVSEVGPASSSAEREISSSDNHPPSAESSSKSVVKPVDDPSTPKAKAIVIVHNPEGKKGKTKKDSSRIKRLLSITRRDSVSRTEALTRGQ